MGLLERLRSTTPADLYRDTADVLGLREGDDFRVGKEGLTIGNETVPLDVVLAEMRRVQAPPPLPTLGRIKIEDL